MLGSVQTDAALLGALQVRLHTLSFMLWRVVMLLGIYLFSDRRSVAQQRWISFRGMGLNE